MKLYGDGYQLVTKSVVAPFRCRTSL